MCTFRQSQAEKIADALADSELTYDLYGSSSEIERTRAVAAAATRNATTQEIMAGLILFNSRFHPGGW